MIRPLYYPIYTLDCCKPKPMMFDSKSDIIKYNVSYNTDQVSFSGLNPGKSAIKSIITENFFKVSSRTSKRRFSEIFQELKGKIEVVDIKTKDKINLVAWDINPKKNNKYVIYLHGSAQNISNNQHLYSEIAKTKFGLFIPEYRNHGINPKTKVNEKKIIKDAEAALEYLKNKNISTKNIGLIGHSMGTFPAVKLAEKNPDLAFTVLISSVSSSNLAASNINRKYIKLPSIVKKMLKNNPLFLQKITDGILKIDESLSNTQVPAYFIHSNNDKVYGINNVEELSKRAKKIVEFIKLPNGGHRMEESKISTIVDILNKKL